MVVINKSLVDLHTPLKDFGIAYKEEGFINYLELYIDLPTKRLSFRLQTMVVINKRLGRSAYTTKRLWFRLQRRGVYKLFRDLSTTKKGGYKQEP